MTNILALQTLEGLEDPTKDFCSAISIACTKQE